MSLSLQVLYSRFSAIGYVTWIQYFTWSWLFNYANKLFNGDYQTNLTNEEYKSTTYKWDTNFSCCMSRAFLLLFCCWGGGCWVLVVEGRVQKCLFIHEFLLCFVEGRVQKIVVVIPPRQSVRLLGLVSSYFAFASLVTVQGGDLRWPIIRPCVTKDLCCEKFICCEKLMRLCTGKNLRQYPDFASFNPTTTGGSKWPAVVYFLRYLLNI